MGRIQRTGPRAKEKSYSGKASTDTGAKMVVISSKVVQVQTDGSVGMAGVDEPGTLCIGGIVPPAISYDTTVGP